MKCSIIITLIAKHKETAVIGPIFYGKYESWLAESRSAVELWYLS